LLVSESFVRAEHIGSETRWGLKSHLDGVL
jgi:hypothetical protein